MADKVKIIELDIDIEGILAKSIQLKADLDSLRAAQAELKKSGDTSSEAFIKNAAQISKLSSEYNVNQKQLANLTTAGGSFNNVQDQLNLLLAKEVTSVKEASDANKALKEIRNSLNTTTEEGRNAIASINETLDKNTQFITNNVSENEKLKIGIGGYKDAIKSAIAETDLYNGQLSGLRQTYDAAGKILSPFKEDIVATAKNMRSSAVETEGMSAAQKGLTIATNIGSGAMRIFALAVAATGVGAIVIVIALLINYFRQLDPVVDVIEQGFAGLGGVIDFVTNLVGDFVTNLKSGADLLQKMKGFLSDPIGSLKSLGSEMAKAAEEAAKLKEREQELADQLDINSIKNKQQESEIARLMIQAKDRSKSAAEQNKAFADAEKLNEEIFNRNKKAASEALDIAIETAKRKKKLSQDEIEDLKNLNIERANAFLNEGKITSEAYDKLKAAFEGRIDVENQYNERLDKITTKSNNAIEKQQAEAEKRRKEIEEARQKALDEAASLSKVRLDLFLSEQGIKAKSLEEELRLNEKVLAKKLEIAKKEYDASKKTQADKLQLLVDENNAKNEYLQKQNDLVVDNARRELDAYLELNKSKIDANKFLSEEILKQEKERLEAVEKERLDFEALRLENGVINEQEYQDAVKKVKDETRIAEEEAQKERDQAAADKKILDVENELAQNQLDFETSLALQIERLNLQKEAELKNAEKTGADKKLILQKYADAEVSLRNAVEQTKLGLVAQGLSQAKGFFKENTVAYKALAVAEATINTYKAASLALSSYAYPVGGIFAGLAIAQGLVQVGNIVGVKLAKGAVDLQGPGSTTSDSIPAMLSRGESVIKADATANNKDLLRAINANANIDFARQVFPTSIANVYNSNPGAPIDYDLLASKLASANLALPAPVVYTKITDVEEEINERKAIVEGANF